MESSTEQKESTNQDASSKSGDSTIPINHEIQAEDSSRISVDDDGDLDPISDAYSLTPSPSPTPFKPRFTSASTVPSFVSDFSPPRELFSASPPTEANLSSPRRNSRRNPDSIQHSLFEWEEQGVTVNTSRRQPPGEMSRVQRGRGAHGRDAHKDVDEEATLFAQLISGLQEAQAANARQEKLAQQIIDLEEAIRKKGSKKTLADISALDDLYRQNLKAAEEEAEIFNTHELYGKMETYKALKLSEESQARNTLSTGSKSRNVKRGLGGLASTNDGDGAESPVPSPSETVMSDKLKRVKSGPGQRSTSVGSQVARSLADSVASKIDDGADGLNRGTNAEKAGQLTVGAEVVYKHNKKQHGQQEGEGIQCMIKNISGDGVKKRLTYDIQDIDEDQDGHKTSYKATAAYLIPIPQSGNSLPTFSINKQVLAKYPDTTTFYRAEVTGIQKDAYRLKFEGEEDDKEMEVDRRFVLDIGLGSK